MTNSPLREIGSATAVEICSYFDLSRQARPLLKAGMDPGDFVAALAAKKEYLTGIDFLAHAIPARQTIWWGCLCVRHAFGAGLLPRDKQACRAAVQWLLQPTELNRISAKGAADAAGPGSSCGALALAASQTGFAVAKTIASSVKSASAQSEPVKIIDTQRLFLELGVDIAEGRWTWQECLGAPRSWHWEAKA